MTTSSLDAPALDLDLVPAQQPAPPRLWRKGTGRAVGSAGEVLCGATSGLGDVVMALPIQLLSVVDLRFRSALTTTVHDVQHRPCLSAAIEEAMVSFGLPPADVYVKYRSDGRDGVGQASSGADVLAAVRAVAAAADVEPTVSEIASTVARVESEVCGRFSGLGRSGLALSNRVTGATLNELPWWPQFAVLTVVPARDRVPVAGRATEETLSALQVVSPRRDSILADVLAAAEGRDVERFAAASTASAELRDSIAPHAGYRLAKEALEYLEGPTAPLGIVVSHTGDAAALLYSSSSEGRNAASRGAHLLGPAFRDQARLGVSVTPRCDS